MNESIADLINHAISLGKQGKLPEAMALFRQALAVDPGNFEALHGMGVALGQTGDFNQALDFFTRAARIKPDEVRVHYNQGLMLNKLLRQQEAMASFDRAIALNSDHVECHFNRGLVLHRLQRYDEAVASFDTAISLRPNFAEAYLNRGNLLHDMNRYQEAVADYDRALALRPNFPEAYFNRGNSLRDLRHHKEALASYDQAISLRPGYVKAILNKGLLYLLLGDYEAGWPLYEWRWQQSHMEQSVRQLKQPLWLGRQSLTGKTILLYYEQGLGDIIQFVRYVPLVNALGAKVILEVPPSLVALFRTLEGDYALISQGDPYPEFDYHCPLMSLPLALKTTLATIPTAPAYLHAEPWKSTAWAQRLQDFSKLKVGLVWAGGIRPNQPMAMLHDAHRSLHLSAFAPLADVPNVHFFSLQKGPPSSQLAELKKANWTGPEIVDYPDALNDWSDTAALVDNLDLVISCDTSVAHLTGALGKPVWILNRYDSCWRWLLDREDSPWYPSVRLFRQDRPGDWAGVIDRVRSELRHLTTA